jgi:hypothetical protein
LLGEALQILPVHGQLAFPLPPAQHVPEYVLGDLAEPRPHTKPQPPRVDHAPGVELSRFFVGADEGLLNQIGGAAVGQDAMCQATAALVQVIGVTQVKHLPSLVGRRRVVVPHRHVNEQVLV